MTDSTTRKLPELKRNDPSSSVSSPPRKRTRSNVHCHAKPKSSKHPYLDNSTVLEKKCKDNNDDTADKKVIATTIETKVMEPSVYESTPDDATADRAKKSKTSPLRLHSVPTIGSIHYRSRATLPSLSALAEPTSIGKGVESNDETIKVAIMEDTLGTTPAIRSEEKDTLRESKATRNSACDSCHFRHRRCDRKMPCSECLRIGLKCGWARDSVVDGSSKKSAKKKEKTGQRVLLDGSLTKKRRLPVIKPEKETVKRPLMDGISAKAGIADEKSEQKRDSPFTFKSSSNDLNFSLRSISMDTSDITPTWNSPEYSTLENLNIIEPHMASRSSLNDSMPSIPGNGKPRNPPTIDPSILNISSQEEKPISPARREPQNPTETPYLSDKATFIVIPASTDPDGGTLNNFSKTDPYPSILKSHHSNLFVKPRARKPIPRSVPLTPALRRAKMETGNMRNTMPGQKSNRTSTAARLDGSLFSSSAGSGMDVQEVIQAYPQDFENFYSMWFGDA